MDWAQIEQIINNQIAERVAYKRKLWNDNHASGWSGTWAEMRTEQLKAEIAALEKLLDVLWQAYPKATLKGE